MSYCQQTAPIYKSPPTFPSSSIGKWGLLVPTEIQTLLDRNCPAAVGVSGGKDSQAVALRVYDYLDEMGYQGPKLLIHSDLGRIEWKQSLPVCSRLAEKLQTELVVVRREAGDLIQRWETRWENNLRRYKELSCVRLIMPFSAPSMRFCQSELKSAVISRALLKRFPDRPIISVTGIRASESSVRAKQPVAAPQVRLSRRGIVGWDWRPIHGWSTEDVFSYIASKGQDLHPAYKEYGCSRVSCAYCIMQSLPDMEASARCPENAAAYHLVVGLEIRSGFSFQQGRWLGDIAKHLLSEQERADLIQAKLRADQRTRAESLIPKHMLFTAGWPQALPSMEEARLLGRVREEVFDSIGMTPTFTDADEIIARYAELLKNSPAQSREPTLFDGEAVTV